MANDTPLPDKKKVAARWGEAVAGGFQPVPHSLFRYQAELGLSSGEMLVLLNILDHWWQTTWSVENQTLPYPSVAALAKRMRVTPRTVQRAVEALEAKKLMVRARTQSKKGESRRGFDPAGLISRLQQIVREKGDLQATISAGATSNAISNP